MTQLNVKKIIVGKLEENCYIAQKDNKALLIDPGDEYEKISQELKELDVVEILLTHNHFDHVGALDYFEKKYHLIHNNFSNQYFDYQVIPTPGHSKDSLTFYFPKEKIMFTGDFLFQGTIGRMDLPGGDIQDMKNSLNLISTYPNDIIIYPGHGNKSILEFEKNNFNYYI